MAKFLIVWADGIGTRKLDPRDADSILLDVVMELMTSLREHGHQVADHKVNWKASMAMVGGNTSWHNAAHGGVIDIDNMLNATAGDERIIMLGYSGGCKVIHDWLDTRRDELHRVAAVGLLSDPFRPRYSWQYDTPDPGGSGICGERDTPVRATFWTSFHKDVISSCPFDSPLRTLADLSDKIPGSFVEDFGDHIRLGNWQLANYIGMWRKDPLGYFRQLGPRLDAARRGVEGYLTGAHTTAYTRPFGTGGDRPLTLRLAHTISYRVRKDLKETP